MKTIAALVLAVLGLHSFSAAAVPTTPGALDNTFGVNAIATAPSTKSVDIVYGATGSTGAYVTGGAVRGDTQRLFLAKFQSDGTLDPTFGTGGRAMPRLDYRSVGYNVRQQSDGKLVVSGTYSPPSGDQWLVVRFNGDGSLDTSFGTGGMATGKVNFWTLGFGLSILSTGKIVVVGATAYNPTNSTYDMAIFRLNADGSADTSFGTGGVKTLDFRAGFDVANTVFDLGTGQILVAGISSIGPSGQDEYSIARLNADGSVDTTFGPPAQNGLVLVDAGGGYSAVNEMTVAGGAIWLVGNSTRASDGRAVMSVAKLTSNGALDTSFGGTGTATVSPGTGQAYGSSLAVSAGKVVVAGYYGGHFAMARLNADGTPDATFGSAGIVVDPDPASLEGIMALTIPGDGTIVAAGSAPEVANNFSQDIMRVRYNATTGARDSTFGTGGKVLTNLFDLTWDVRAAAIMPNGKITLAGALSDSFDSDFGIMQLNPDGTPYIGFGYFGTNSVPFARSDDRAFGMLTRADGKYVLGGISNQLGTGYFALARVSDQGFSDTTFGTQGQTTTTLGIGFAQINALADFPGNRIVAAGYAVVGSGNNDFAVARYKENGTLDTTFGGTGVVITSFGTGSDIANAVAVQPDGRTVAAGAARIGASFDFAVARYLVEGGLDTTFGTGGKVTIPIGTADDIAHALAILPDGKILVAGESFNSISNNDMAVVRLNANGSIDTTFGVSGISIVNFAGGPDAAWAMAVQRNGKIVLAGSAYDGANRGFALARLNADGTRDTGFGFGYAAGGLETLDITGSLDTAYAVMVQRDGKIVSAGTAGTQWAVTRVYGDPVGFATDLDGSGKSDILYRNFATGQVYRLLMNGLATASSGQAYVEPDLNWKIVGDGDFNGDGVTDLLWRNSATGAVYVMPFTASAMPGPGAVVHIEPNPAWKIVSTPDIDGDGKADIVWWNANTGQVYVMLVNGLTLGAQGLMYTEPNLAWTIVASGDFSGSGKHNQLLWRNSSTGDVFLMTVSVVSNTFGYTGQMIYNEPNLAWKIVGAGDFDGDGKSDILWRNDVTGEVYIMLMNGTVIANHAIVYTEPNTAWKVAALGDYDGDGKSDVLYRNDVTGQVYMLLMNGLAVASQGMVYTEPNTQWKVLGPYEYSQ